MTFEEVVKWLPIVSLLVAIIAIIFGPLISLRLGKKQIIAPMRQKWIDSLREMISEITAKAIHFRFATKGAMKQEEMLELNLLANKIELNLNAKEKDHQELHGEIGSMIMLIKSQIPNDEQKFWDSTKKITEISKRVLKKEWEAVKK